MEELRKSSSRRFFAFACVLLVAVFIYGCKGNVEQKSILYKLSGGLDVEIVVIDSCEYIKINGGNATWGSHKGNCKFCIERSKK
jgi:hypothetical protein